MKIPTNDIVAFLKKPPSSIRGVLIYGPDSGLVSEHLRELSLSIVEDIHDPFRVAELPYDRIKEDAALLADELAALSMMGGRRLIRVRDAAVSLPASLEKILLDPIGDSLLIITSGELPPASSLRRLFESAKHLAALPCYKDEAAGIRTVINNRLRQHGFSCDGETLPLLAELLAGDRMVILQEIDKLMLYMGNTNYIKASDVLACMGEPLEVSLDSMCSDIASGKTAAVQAQIERLYKENTSPITIIRAVSRYFMRLYQVKSMIAAGTPAPQAIQGLKPPLFFKHVPLFSQQVHKWPMEKLIYAIGVLAHLEAQCKKTGQPASLLCSRLMISLAHTASR